MDEPIELQDLVLNSSNKDAETAYEILDTSRDDVNDYMRIDKLAETITQPVNDRDNAAQRVDKADVSKQGTDAVAVRKLKIFCIILTTMVLISSGTTGALIHTLVS